MPSGIKLLPGELSPEMLLAVEYLALPKRGGYEIKEIAKICSVDPRTLRRWRKNPDFQEAIRKRALAIMAEKLPDVLNSMTAQAIRGSGKHTELFLKSLQILKDTQEVTIHKGEDRSTNEEIEKDIERLSRLLDDDNYDPDPIIEVDYEVKDEEVVKDIKEDPED